MALIVQKCQQITFFATHRPYSHTWRHDDIIQKSTVVYIYFVSVWFVINTNIYVDLYVYVYRRLCRHRNYTQWCFLLRFIIVNIIYNTCYHWNGYFSRIRYGLPKSPRPMGPGMNTNIKTDYMKSKYVCTSIRNIEFLYSSCPLVSGPCFKVNVYWTALTWSF